MRIVLLGASGQLGHDILRAQRAKFPDFQMIPLRRNDLDVSKLDDIEKTLLNLDFEVLINCVSYNRVDDAEAAGTDALLINSQAAARIAAACKEKGARLVHTSTDYVFGGGHSLPYSETDAPSPVNVYGASKFLGECLILRKYAEDTLIVRMASLFGTAGSSGKGGNFVETILRIAKEKGEVRVVNDIRMSPTSTADAAWIILSLIQARAAQGIYHAVNTGHASWFEFARDIVRRGGLPARVIPVSRDEFRTVARRPSYSVLDNSKVSRLVGPIAHWEDALERYLGEKGHGASPACPAS
ncbi:MAG TPA: dTDP-4-dehydrorhamnose reductase [Terriglobia bacterium]|nr:dTDP-4-dehydrorhamnose reductase [Terriglobia bacterium]